MMNAPERFILQDSNLAPNYQVWQMTGPVIMMPDWFQVPVQLVEYGQTGIMESKEPIAIILLAEGTAGPQGPAGPAGPAGPQGDPATQTPWATDVNAASHNLNSVAGIGIGNGTTHGSSGILIDSNAVYDGLNQINSNPSAYAGINLQNDGGRSLALRMYGSTRSPASIARLEHTTDLSVMANTTEAIRVKGVTANVGIRQSAPAYPLDVAGDVNVTGVYRLNGVEVGLGEPGPPGPEGDPGPQGPTGTIIKGSVASWAQLPGNPVLPLAISNTPLPNAAVGMAYSASQTASGGVTPYTYSAFGLPAGLAINPATGAITGTPTFPAAATPVTIKAADSSPGTPQLASTSGLTLTVTGTAIMLVAHTGTNVVPTGAIDTTGASLLVVVVGNYGVPGTVTDSKGNTYTLGYSVVSGSQCLRFYYCPLPITGAGHTFTFTGSYCSVEAIAFSGTSGGGVDQSSQSMSTQNVVQPGSITPTLDGEVLITGCSADGNVWPSASISGGGFTAVLDNIPYAGGNGEPLVVAICIQTAKAPSNPTWNLGNPGQLCGIVSFK
jgi:Putative Ig domain